MIGCARTGKNLIFYDNKCSVKGREEQHDPMIMAWQFKCSESHQLNARPAKKKIFLKPAKTLQQIAIGAEAHADEKAKLMATQDTVVESKEEDEHADNSGATEDEVQCKLTGSFPKWVSGKL